MAAIPYHIMTFGCQMNVNDSRWLAQSLEGRGLRQGNLEDARVVILNTCAVREKPEAKVAAAIARIVAINPEAIICVLGCVAQSLGKKLYDCAPEVRLLAGGDGLVHVPGAIAELLADPDLRLAFLEFTGDYAERGGCSVVGGSAYVNIMQGCDNFCAYCIVPYTRGRQKSRKRVNILAECARCVEAGALEITLLGQNVNAWGRDGGISGNFASLLAEVSAMPGLARLRFVAVHPRDMDEGSIAAFAELPNVCPCNRARIASWLPCTDAMTAPVFCGLWKVCARPGRT